jgi:hypothetical protein
VKRIPLHRFLGLTLLALVPFPSLAQTATAWPEADRLFHADPRWLGGDAAFSVDLGNGRVLWLFGDSFVATKPGRGRSASRMPRNTVAMQNGYDPSRASIRFYWRTSHGAPASFFREQSENWLWPMHGVRLADHLLLFFNVVGTDRDPKSLGFRGVGWEVFMVSNLDLDPFRWVIRRVQVSENPWKITVGVAVVQEGDYLHVFSYDEPRHDAYLLRLPISLAKTGNFSELEWWCGTARGWMPQEKIEHAPEPVFTEGSTEFSVHWDSVTHQYVEVQSTGFGASDISVRWSPHLEGPWTPPRTVYRPPESDGANPFVYAGKAHPELTGADLVLTYVANGSDERLAKDMSIYFPRFVRIRLHE